MPKIPKTRSVLYQSSILFLDSIQDILAFLFFTTPEGMMGRE